MEFCALKVISKNRMQEKMYIFILLRGSVSMLRVLVHDGGRTLVRAEYGYPKGSPNTKS
jgi:hypothetical protein